MSEFNDYVRSRIIITLLGYETQAFVTPKELQKLDTMLNHLLAKKSFLIL